MILLPDKADPPKHYRLAIPAGSGRRAWITENQRLHWGSKAALVRRWRESARVYARHQRMPPLDGGHIICELRFADRRRRDPHNWTPTAKACVDGLVDAGVFPDDSSSYVDGPDMRIGPVVPRGFQTLIIHIWPMERR